jgi:Xaa-Pro aminopeptidase
MKPVATDPAMFVANRQRLRELLPEQALVVVHSNDIMPTNADGTMGHHQNADLYYLTGILQEESILLMAPGAFDEKLREVLFVREPSEQSAIWEGHKLSKEEAAAVSGVKNVKWLTEFSTTFRALMCECDQVFLNSNEHPRAAIDVETRDARFIAWCQAHYPLHRYERLARLMRTLRVVKQPLEIELIRRACGITRSGFLRVLGCTRAGLNEADIEAEFAHEFIRNKAVFAYPPIIAAGKNNCVLHYNQNDQELVSGQLLLLDVAAGYGQYASDLTRTIPVSGRFTDRQRAVYDAVLRVLRAITRLMVPGCYLTDLRTRAEQLIEQELLGLGVLNAEEVARQDPEKPLFKKFFMHGVAHPLGLDVHDVGLARQPVAPGWVLTCEPAIYLADEGFGIRLENDILVTESEPVDLMAEIPIEADEIERLMS